MTRTISITGTGKKALIDINEDSEVVGVSIYHNNGSESHYSKKHCAKNSDLLYNLIKNSLYAY